VNFKADNLQPGYRWLDLHGDGRVETGVCRLSDEQFTVEPDAGGYL
jgi:Icc protein